MRRFFIEHWWAVGYGCLLTAFTVYLMLDTFWIARIYHALPQGQSAQPSGVQQPATAPLLTDTSYTDENITITLTQYRQHDTDVYVADVRLSSAKYLKTAFSQNAYGRNLTAKTSETAAEVGAILAINGDYYGAQEKDYVLRNGTIYRNTPVSGREDLAIDANGSFKIITEDETTAEELLSDGVVQVLSFGPTLVVEGSVAVTEEDEVGKAKASNPRTAIGIVDALHYLFVVSDGRTEQSAGLTLAELATLMVSLGATTAYNLDGGGSSTMVFNGEVINTPTTNGRTIQERSVSDIVYIGY